MLDLLLWLGPRVSIQALFLPVVEQALAQSAQMPIGQLESIRQLLTDWLARYNLLTLLRTYPIGISSLMVVKLPALTPWGQPVLFQVQSLTELLVGMVVLNVLGWIGGGMYFRQVSQAVIPQEQSVISLGRTLWQTIVLSLLFSLVTLVVMFPLFLVITLIALLSPIVAQVAVLVILFLGAWLIIPLFFAPHGMYLRGQNVLASLYAALRLARFTLPSSGLFVLTVFVLGQGLNYLWLVPPDDSWMLLVGIAGHAFITTALLAASFVYYREIYVWLDRVLQHLRPGAPASRD